MPDVAQDELDSELMRRAMPYMVILPDDYPETNLRYPVLYLLHGLFGAFDNWVTLTGLTKYAADHKLIIVTPEGHDGWYTDSPIAEDGKYESYLIRELLPTIDASYRTIAKRRGRAIAGLSMGGYGAIKFGIKTPHLFALTASISGAFDAPLWSDEDKTDNWEEFRPSIMRAFDEAKSESRIQNDLYKLAAEIPDETLSELPRIYFDCGTEDSFISANRKLDALFTARNIEHVYRELPGGHDWNYRDSRARHILKLASETLERPAS